jgi:hypothetical protein
MQCHLYAVCILQPPTQHMPHATRAQHPPFPSPGPLSRTYARPCPPSQPAMLVLLTCPQTTLHTAHPHFTLLLHLVLAPQRQHRRQRQHLPFLSGYPAPAPTPAPHPHPRSTRLGACGGVGTGGSRDSRYAVCTYSVTERRGTWGG